PTSAPKPPSAAPRSPASTSGSTAATPPHSSPTSPTSAHKPPTRAQAAASTAAKPSPAACAPSPQPPATSSRFSQSSRSEEHTSELQSREKLVCRLLLEKKTDRVRAGLQGERTGVGDRSERRDPDARHR